MDDKRKLILMIIFGLFLVGLFRRNAGLLWMTLPFLFYVGAGMLTAPKATRLSAARAVEPSRCETGVPISMQITIQNDGPAVPRLHILEQIHPRIRVLHGPTDRSLPLPAGATAELGYTFQAQRGQYRWENAWVFVSDPFGLFQERLALPAAAETRVLPEQLPIRRLRLRPRQTLRTPGPNLSRLPGSGIDFYGVREFRPGDSLRWVHWRKSARSPGQFFSKEFEREEVANIGLILDGSAALNLNRGSGSGSGSGSGRGSEELFEYSVKAAAAICRNLLRVGNRVSLLTLGSEIVRIFPGIGKRQLVRILDHLASCQPGERTSLTTLKYMPVKLFPSHSLIIIISPLSSKDYSAIARLRAGGYQVLLISPNPVCFADQSTRWPLAYRAAQVERSALLWRIREIGVQVIDWSVDQPLFHVIDNFVWERR